MSDIISLYSDHSRATASHYSDAEEQLCPIKASDSRTALVSSRAQDPATLSVKEKVLHINTLEQAPCTPLKVKSHAIKLSPATEPARNDFSRERRKSPLRQSFQNLIAAFTKKSKQSSDLDDLSKQYVPLPAPLGEPFGHATPSTQGEVGTLGSLKEGPLFYLDQNEKVNRWRRCHASLVSDKIVLEWLSTPTFASITANEDHAMVHEVMLYDCVDVRSLLTEEHPLTKPPDDIRDIFKLQYGYDLQLGTKQPDTIIAARSVTERASWVSKLWDVIMELHARSSVPLDPEIETAELRVVTSALPSSIAPATPTSLRTHVNILPTPSKTPEATRSLVATRKALPSIPLGHARTSSVPNSPSIVALEMLSLVRGRVTGIERERQLVRKTDKTMPPLPADVRSETSAQSTRTYSSRSSHTDSHLFDDVRKSINASSASLSFPATSEDDHGSNQEFSRQVNVIFREAQHVASAEMVQEVASKLDILREEVLQVGRELNGAVADQCLRPEVVQILDKLDSLIASATVTDQKKVETPSEDAPMYTFRNVGKRAEPKDIVQPDASSELMQKVDDLANLVRQHIIQVELTPPPVPDAIVKDEDSLIMRKLESVEQIVMQEKESRSDQAAQQVETVRYLTDLNQWLETFGNGNGTHMQHLGTVMRQIQAYLALPNPEPDQVPPKTIMSDIQSCIGEKTDSKVEDALRNMQASIDQLVANKQQANQESLPLLLEKVASELTQEIRGERLRFVEAMKEATAINVKNHVDEFKKQLSHEVSIMTHEVARLQQERQLLEHQIAELFSFFSKQRMDTTHPRAQSMPAQPQDSRQSVVAPAAPASTHMRSHSVGRPLPQPQPSPRRESMHAVRRV